MGAAWGTCTLEAKLRKLAHNMCMGIRIDRPQTTASGFSLPTIPHHLAILLEHSGTLHTSQWLVL